MKENPLKQSTPKQKYSVHVEIEDEVWDMITTATDENKAVNNVMFRISEEIDEDVGLLMWKYKNDKIDVEVEEV